MKSFQSWLVWVLLPVWLSIYLIGFRTVGPLIFIPLVIGKGIWWATFIVFLVYAVWGTVFYLLILFGGEGVTQKVQEIIGRWSQRKDSKILSWVWVRKTLGWIQGALAWFQKIIPLVQEKLGRTAPLGVLATFIVMGVLEGVLLIWVSYPRKFLGKALLLVWVGCAVEVLTWFLPVYGGLLALVRALLASWFGF